MKNISKMLSVIFLLLGVFSCGCFSTLIIEYGCDYILLMGVVSALTLIGVMGCIYVYLRRPSTFKTH